MNPFIWAFMIPLITWRLGMEVHNLAKPPTFAKKFSFAKLYANVVEIGAIYYVTGKPRV